MEGILSCFEAAALLGILLRLLKLSIRFSFFFVGLEQYRPHLIVIE